MYAPTTCSCPKIRLFMTFSAVCNTWFDLTTKSLSRPFSAHEMGGGSRDNTSTIRRGRNRQDFGMGSTLPSHMQAVYKRLRTERQNYKNVRIHVTPLPQSPTVSSVRHKQEQGSSFRRSFRKRMLPMPLRSQKQHGIYQIQTRYTGRSRSQNTQLPIQNLETSNINTQVPEYPSVTHSRDASAADTLSDALLTTNPFDIKYPFGPLAQPLLSSTSLATNTQNKTVISALQAASPGSPRSPRSATSQSPMGTKRIAQTVVSEPNWQAMSDTASTCAARTTPATTKLDYLQPNGREVRKRPSTARRSMPKFDESSWVWKCIRDTENSRPFERLWVEVSLETLSAQTAHKDYPTRSDDLGFRK